MRAIPLTQGKMALVDDEDYDRLVAYKWHASKGRHTFYAGRVPRSYMHHEVLDDKPEPGLEVDHRDGNGLNNQKGNLRWVTRSQNHMNQHSVKKSGTSKYKGVTWCKVYSAWHARIQANGKSKRLGYFDIEADAARAYDTAARKYFGEFAYLNFRDRENPSDAR